MSRFAQSVVWAGVCAVLVAVSVEATVRADDWSQHRVPVSSGFTGLGELLIVDSLGPHARPGAQFRKFRINSLGYRGPDIDGSALASHPIVLVAGASETFGLYESADHEWPRQLQTRLQAACGASAPIVMNGAFAGMSLPTVTADIRRRGAALKPRMVIYYPTPMQYIEEKALPKATPAGTVAAPAPPWWRLRAPARFRDAFKTMIPLPVLDWLRQRDTKRQRSVTGFEVFNEVPSERLDAFERDLRELVGATHGIGATSVLVAHRHRFADTASVDQRRWLRAWERFYPLATGAVLLEFDRQAGERTRRVALDSGAVFVDPDSGLREIGVSAFADFSHFTDRGSAAMAAAVGSAVGPSLGCGGR